MFLQCVSTVIIVYIIISPLNSYIGYLTLNEYYYYYIINLQSSYIEMCLFLKSSKGNNIIYKSMPFHGVGAAYINDRI